MSQVQQKCAAAASTLRELLLTAAQRGISIEDSFAHFNSHQDGVVDLAQFVLGLRSLGIPLSVEAASVLMRQLSAANNTYLTVQDFQKLCAQLPTTKKKKLAAVGPPPKAKRNKLTPENEDVESPRVSKEERLAQAQGLPQWAHNRSKRALKELRALSKKHKPMILGPHDSLDATTDEDDEVDDTSPQTTPEVIPPLPLDPKPESSQTCPISSQFRTFDTSDGVVFEYALLKAPIDPLEAADDDAAPWTSEALADAQSHVSRQLSTPKSHLALRLIVVLDVFQTIAVVQAMLQPVFQQYSSAKVLVVGHPLSFPMNFVLNNVLLSKYMGELLLHLQSSREWVVQPKYGPGAVPQVLLGFGSGASVATHFSLITAPQHFKLHVLNQALHGVVLFNGFCSTDGLKSALQQLLHGLNAKNETECHEQLLNMLFSESYLNQTSRKTALATFFQHRRRFLNSSARPRLIRLLQGVLKHQDIRPLLRNAKWPLFLVHSSQNKWIPPAQVVDFQEKRQVSTTFDDIFVEKDSRVHISWLKAGHEVVQERPAFFPQFVDQIFTAIQNAIVNYRPEPETTANSTSKAAGEGEYDKNSRLRAIGDDDDTLVLGEANTVNSNEKNPKSNELLPQVREIFNSRGIKGIRQELVDRSVEIPPLGREDQLLWLLHRTLQAEFAALQAEESRKQAKREQEREIEQKKQQQELEKEQKRQRELARQTARFQKEAQAFKAKEEQRLQRQKRAEHERKERSSMELEDQFSRKREVYDAKLLQWQATNEQALVNVEALHEERKEYDEEQAAIQQGLDRAAQRAALQANLWALQRQMETSQVSLRGDVEGYGLECNLDTSSIPAFVHGTQCLMDDLSALAKHKQSTLALQKASLAKQSDIQAKLQDATRMYQTWTRVLQRAEDEKVIAKPDVGGSVRLLPATAQAMRLLREKINEIHQEVSHLNSVDAVANEEVATFDRVLQGLAVMQKRVDTALSTIQSKAKAFIAEANLDLATTREEQQNEVEADAKGLDDTNKLTARLKRIQNELERMQTLDTPFIDTDVYISGTFQRVERQILQKKLQEESQRLEIELKLLDEQAEKAKELRNTLKNQSLVLTEALSSLLQADAQLAHVLSKIQQLGTLPNEHSSGETKLQITKSAYLIDEIRRNPVEKRTAIEKQWIALDIMLNPELYLRLSEHDSQEMRVDPLYKTTLTRADVERLLNLPERIHLALPFLKLPAEIHAHQLLREYSKDDGEDMLNEIDLNFVPKNEVIQDLDTAMRRQLGAVVRQKPLENCSPEEIDWRRCDAVLQSASNSTPDEIQSLPCNLSQQELRKLAVEPSSDHPIWKLLYKYGSLTRPPVQIVDTLADIVAAPDHCILFVDTKTNAKLLQITRSRLRARQSATHAFQVHLDVIHLTISIVFEGKFTSVGYQVGRLAAMLYYMEPNASPQPIGQVKYADVSLNTRESLGRIVIRHAPRQLPVAQGIFHIVVGCPSETIYSIEVDAHVVTPVRDFIKHAKQTALTNQARLPVGRQEIAQYWQSMRLAERKLLLVKQAAAEAMKKAKEAQTTIETLQKSLESTNPPTTESLDRTQVLQKIRETERYFTKQCKRHTIRIQEIRDIQQGLQHLASLHAGLLLERAKLESSLRDFRQHLPDATGRIEGHTAGFKIGYALGADYHVVKTAKMRWRDIAALKGQLRTLITSAQRVRRKYKKDRHALSAKERQWILLDRIRFPDLYLWELEAVQAGDFLQERALTPPGMELTTMEKTLLAWTPDELNRILTVPVNQLRNKELQLRKIMLSYRDTKISGVPEALLASWRTKSPEELKPEQREWVALERILHPELYSNQLQPVIPSPWTKEKLISLIQTPEEQIAMLAPKERQIYDLVWHYDKVFCENTVAPSVIPMTHHPVAHNQQGIKVEVDIDMRCRLVLQELDRAISNPNDMMDSSILHSAPQRFPTKVLRLELEKELDRLLLAQLYEREDAAWKAIASTLDKKGDDAESSDSDLEAQIARQAKAKSTKSTSDKKAKPSFQKQKRAIQDALIPKTIEQEQLELERKQLGPGGCMACKTNPCKWEPYLADRLPSIELRIKVLQDEIERVKRSKEAIVSSTVCLTAVRANNGATAISFRKMDLFLELTNEAKAWEKHIRLRAVDTELHATYNWTESHIQTVALHGFTQMQQTEKVQAALTREQSTLVAQLVTVEVIEDILEYMLEGWHFGERESQRKVQGYVPSIYKDGPLTVHALRSISKLQQDPLICEKAQVEEENALKAKFGTPFESWTPLEVDAQQTSGEKAVQPGSTVSKVLNETEQALKFGLFCLTLMYFRGLSLLQKQKKTWNVKAAASKTAKKENTPTLLQIERSNRQHRQRALETASAVANQALDRKYQREQAKIQAYRNKLHAHHRLAKLENKSSTQIQRVFRGYLGRTASAKWKIRRAELEALQALETAAATTMQRAYRGRLGRLAAEARRIELAEFIAQIRAEEAIVEEEEYWKRNIPQRLRRQFMGFLEHKAS
ncbi:hypothetical protein Ae201684_017766 [Aphanomyces euteiches]|uniref:EF-hand domain-containing protein n=1 Tax=Aphanomyces euteiches TaxID=100861 RepID=A0A6G0W836_9STRA|nr:hypothetical protein Ae201684_017766 [Aphanomyces euteiches]